MKTSDTIEALATALATAQGEMKNATLNRVNPHFKSKYADLAGIRDATAPVLAKHGLTITQFTTVEGESLVLCTRLLHKSGQWMEGEYPLPMALDKPQVMGSALTYARRYCWSAVCGIAAEEDDDGNAAQNSGAKANGKPAEKPAWRGPMKTTELKAAMRELSERMNGGSLGTTGDLDAVQEEYAAVIEQAKHDLPDWHDGFDGTRKRLLATLMVGPASHNEAAE
jgi:hypothetical protein